MTATEDEDPEQKRAWHQRLFKSASQVNRRDSDSSSSEQSRQCVVDHIEGGGDDDGAGSRGPKADDEETQFSTSVSTSPDDAVGGTGDGTAARGGGGDDGVGSSGGPEAEDEMLQQDTDDETRLSTLVSTSPDDAVGGTAGVGTSAHNPNNPNNVALLPSRILMALSLMLILHAMIANL
jgi:hypothetical protein